MYCPSSNLLEPIIKIFLTIVLCSIIGAEREVHHKEAGLRTHILVGVGSALIVLTSFHIFDIYKNTAEIDPTRMITGIITGIGFLCGGTIIRSGNQISGLTTAATLWTVACIGMAVGSGYYAAAIIFTLMIFFVLTGLRSIRTKLKK